MKTKAKINAIVVLIICSIIGAVSLITNAVNWQKYSEAVEVKNVELGLYEARDYAVNGTQTHYYKVVGDVKYVQDAWPNIKMEVLKTDTLLVLHDCLSD